MKTINGMNFAKYLGINLLTGEACAFSMRTLCDVNEKGATLLREYLGLHHEAKFADPWNSMVGDLPSIGSVMLEQHMFPALVHFALMREGYQYVYGRDDNMDSTGFSESDFKSYPDLRDYIDGSARRAGFDQGARLYRNLRPTNQPTEGTRNVHAFSGRAE